MCTVAAAASIGLSVIQGFAKASAERQAGKDAQAEAEYRAAVERNNSIRANFLAEDAIERGKEDEKEERLRGRILLGQIRASLAANGVDVDEGSGLDLQIDQAGTNEFNAATVQNNAAREAQEFRIRASQFDSQADLQISAGNNARTSANNRATGTLLGTAGTVAAKWLQFR